MSFESAIKIEELNKCYHIYETPRDRLKQFFLPRIYNFIGKPTKQYFREFWALKDISFEIKKGETIGIIGRNGSGKSTLLQMICGTLNPTSGNITSQGRIAALLELGSGFNPEFTGRENIYMNAALLGLRREDIEQRFDEIVAFADIGNFLDQPVKTYSSGMYVRLAFAVIVHVNADILVIDEALAVGDMYFQSKCMAHLKKLMNTGVTVLFVSHDINSVKALCTRAIYLEQGNLRAIGPTEDVVEAYFNAGITSDQLATQIKTQPVASSTPLNEKDLISQESFAKRAAFHRIQSGIADFLDVQVIDRMERVVDTVEFGDDITLRMTIRINTDIACLGLAYHIRNKNGLDVIYSDTGIEDSHLSDLHAGDMVIFDWHFSVHLQQGGYSVAAMLSIPKDLASGQVEICDFAPLATNFQVICGDHLPIYGAVHWQNKIAVQMHKQNVMVHK